MIHRSRKPSGLIVYLLVFLGSILGQSYSSAQDSSSIFTLGPDCISEYEHQLIILNETKNVKVKISGVETTSYNDFYVLLLPHKPPRPGIVTEMGFQHWQIKFEDWCDEDWDDLIVDITLEPASPSIVIMRPSDMMSFVTDNYETYSVAAEAYVWDIEGNDISDGIDWWVIPGDNSGECNLAYLIDSRNFHFTASIEPRDIRGADPLEYRIRATVNPYILPLSDVNTIIQDDIDTVRQQYIDYHLKLLYKSQYIIAPPVEIPAEYRTILYDIFEATRSAYRIWADNPSAFFEVSSGYRTPEKNRNLKPDPGEATSLHQYHWAIDMDFGDEGEEGTEDDLEFLRNFLQEYLRHPFDGFYKEYKGHVHIEMFNYSEEFPAVKGQKI